MTKLAFRRFIARLRSLTTAALLALSLLLAAISGTRAQTPPNVADATHLFEQAQSLMESKSYAEACDAYQRSQALDPQLGTLLHLADCQELLGRTADAYRNFLAAAAIAAERTRTGNPEPREQVARRRADQLKEHLVWLHVALPPSAAEPRITLDGAAAEPSITREPQAILPGTHTVSVAADGYNTWSQTVRLEPGARLDLQVPALQPTAVAATTGTEAAPEAAYSPSTPAAVSGTAPGTDYQRIAAYVVGGIGVAGLGTSIFLGARQRRFVSQLRELCPNRGDCPLSTSAYAQFQSENSKAHDYATAFNWTVAISALLVAGGVALYVTAPNATHNDVRVSAGLGSVAINASF